MAKILKFLKVVFLSVITGGLYGAYWLMKNLYDDPSKDRETMTGSEKTADQAQSDLVSYGIQYILRK